MKKILTFALVAVMLLSVSFAIPLKNAEAGFTSTSLVNSELFNGALSSGTFKYDKSEDITIDEDNIIHFGGSDTNNVQNAKLSIKGMISGESNVTDFLDVAIKLNIKEITNGNAFVIAMAMKGQNDNFGQNGLELRFMSGLSYEVVHLKSGTPSTLYSGTFANNKPDLMINVDNATLGHTITISDGGLDLCSVNVAETLQGFFAFGYNGGKCKVDVERLKINSYSYERAINPGTITENFDDNCFNANLFISESNVGAYTPSFAHVEDGMFVIKNAKAAHFTTLYPYSNVEVNFQIVYVANYLEDADGNVIEYSSSDALNIEFGIADYKESAVTTANGDHSGIRIGGWLYGINSVDRKGTSNQLIFSPVGGGKRTDVRLNGDINPMDRRKTDGRRTDVKIIYKDMQFKIYMKYAEKGVTDFVDYDESKGQTLESVWGAPLLTASTPKQDIGCVRIYSFGSDNVNQTNENNTSNPDYAIDNITIKNLDDNPALCAMPLFKSNVYSLGEIFDYEDTDDSRDLLSSRLNQSLEKNNGRVWVVLAWVLTPVAVLTATVAILFKVKKRVRK